MSLAFLALIGVPTAGQCLKILGPIAGLVMLHWLIRHSDALIHRLFPHLEWERKLGWLNIRSERRASNALRWLGHLIYALLAAALYGIVWGASALNQLGQWPESQLPRELPDRLPVLLASFGFWAVYLAFDLIPRLRKEYEQEELDRYRAGLAELERQRQEFSDPRNPKAPSFSASKPSFVPRPRSRR